MRGGADVPHDASDGCHRPIPPRWSSSVISVIRSWVRASRMASRATRTTSCPSTPRGATSRIAARRTRRARFRLHRAADLLARDQRELPRTGSDKQYHPLPVDRLRIIEDALDRPGTHRCGQPETLRRLRPLRRRAARIDRPARVRIRRRKPCVFARRRVFGWYVRFPLAILGFLRGRKAGNAAGRRGSDGNIPGWRG